MKHWAWLTLAGAIVTAAGLVGGIWMQVDGPFGQFGSSDIEVSYRWQIAMAPLFVVAAGLAVIALAQVVRAVGVREERVARPPL